MILELVNSEFSVGLKTKINFGMNMSAQTGKILSEHGFVNVLICTDKNLVRFRVLSSILKSLDDENIRYAITDDIEINPTIKTILKIKDMFGGEKFDCILGIGGGGPIDVAKGVSIALTHDGDIHDYIAEAAGQKKPINSRVLPIISIPTTAGSGAEISPVAVIVDERRKLKVGFFSELLFPVLAIVDPVLSVSLPPKPTAEGGLDVLSHSFDAFVSRYSNPFSDAVALKAMELVFSNLRTAVWQGENLQARANMAIASLLSLMAIYVGRGGATHTMGEPMGGLYNIAHGYACGIGIPAMMVFLKPVCLEKYVEIYKSAGHYVDPADDKDEIYLRCVNVVKRLIKEINLPVLNNVLLDPDIDMLAEYSINHLAVDRVPAYMTKEIYIGMYKQMLSDDYLDEM